MLDAGSLPGASKITTADDCCNACRQNDQVSACGATLSIGLCLPRAWVLSRNACTVLCMSS